MVSISSLKPFGVTTVGGTPGEPSVSDGLGVFAVRDADGNEVARLYGHLLRGHVGAGLTVGLGQVDADFPIADAETFQIRVLDGLHGAFVAITNAPLPRRLYPDCGASIPVVFCPESRRYGSSAAMFLDDEEYRGRFDHDLHKAVVAGDIGGSWITGTLTAHHGIYRLLPNFYLDLETWSMARFWPRTDDFALDAGFDETVGLVSNAMSGFVEAVADELHAGVTTTAGFDSRILIAAARNVTDRIEFFTLGDPDEGIDQIVAARLAKQLAIRHRHVPIVRSTEEEGRIWDRLVGDVVRESTRDVFPTLANLDYDVILTGMYGETGRARLYRQDAATINSGRATPEFVLSRLTLPTTPAVVENVAEWLEPIQTLPRSAVLDLAFNELRFGSWAMSQAPVQKALQMTMMPFAQRPIQDAFMRMDPVTQGTVTLFAALGQKMWPDAMTHPINKFGDRRDWTSKFTKGNLRHKLIRYARDRFAGLRRTRSG